MKRIAVVIAFIAGMGVSCRQEAQPPEVSATVLGPDYAKCGGCGGTFIKVDSTTYRAELNGYKANTAVWIRYRKRTDVVLNWIEVLSIRVR